jgi:hypothetical protein
MLDIPVDFEHALWGMIAAAVLSGSYKLIADTLASTLRGS